jgi:hypothetical protein
MAGGRLEQSSNFGYHGAEILTTLLDLVHFNYAWVLFVVFLVAFVTNSILSVEASSQSKEPALTGPGGKPLPQSSARKSKEERERRKKLKDFSPRRKLLFLYLSVGLLATFVGNGVNIVIHALKDNWWCGQATAVSGNRAGL